MSRVLWATICLAVVAAAAEPAGFHWRKAAGTTALMQGEQVVWEFQYAPTLTKPAFHPVSLPGGPVLTLDAPADHRWHHAFWFAWKYINGRNYWEERDGEPRGLTSWNNVRLDTRADGSARIRLDVQYRPPDAPPVLTEQREVRVSAPAADGTFHFDWHSTFQAGSERVVLGRTPIPGEPEGKSWGGYAGLSWRFSRELKDWRGAYSTGDTSLEETGKRAAALDISGTDAGKTAGVAFLDHPKNLNAPSPWHVVATTRNSFLFAQPAVLYYGDHTLDPKQRLELRYRVIVHPGRWDAARLNRALQDYTRGELK